MPDETPNVVEVAVRNRVDQPYHEVGFLVDGAFVVFAHVRDGRVLKQTALAAEAKVQALLHPAAPAPVDTQTQ